MNRQLFFWWCQQQACEWASCTKIASHHPGSWNKILKLKNSQPSVGVSPNHRPNWAACLGRVAHRENDYWQRTTMVKLHNVVSYPHNQELCLRCWFSSALETFCRATLRILKNLLLQAVHLPWASVRGPKIHMEGEWSRGLGLASGSICMLSIRNLAN